MGQPVASSRVDEQTLAYMRLTGRTSEQIALVEQYCKLNGLFYDASTPDPEFTDSLELDLATVLPSLAGPKRPQDRIVLSEMKEKYRETLLAPVGPQGIGLAADELERTATYKNGTELEMKHGDIVIAAITSCTNTSNPSVMVGAGLLAKNAVAKGLTVKPYVKTSLAPGSKVVLDYLTKADLMTFFGKPGLLHCGLRVYYLYRQLRPASRAGSKCHSGRGSGCLICLEW